MATLDELTANTTALLTTITNLSNTFTSAKDDAEAAELAAQNAQSYSEEWANKAEDSLVSAAAGGNEVDEYSAFHWAEKAAASAAEAAVTTIEGMDDTTITAIVDLEILQYDSGTAKWINQTLAEAGISATGHVHAASDITSATFADARIAASNVTQHQAALSITESQISDLGSYSLDSHNHTLDSLSNVTITAIGSGEIPKWNGSAWINNTLAEAGISAVGHVHAASDITSSTFADARIAASNVTQHQAALSITESQISDLGSYSVTGHTHLGADITDIAEVISDQLGTMVTGNTESGITVTYDDADNTLDFVLPAVLQNTTASFLTADETHLDNIETAATADQTDVEIETAYNNQVGIVSQAAAEAGTATTAERWTPQRVAQAIAALAQGGAGRDLVLDGSLSAGDPVSITSAGKAKLLSDVGRTSDTFASSVTQNSSENHQSLSTIAIGPNKFLEAYIDNADSDIFKMRVISIDPDDNSLSFGVEHIADDAQTWSTALLQIGFDVEKGVGVVAAEIANNYYAIGFYVDSQGAITSAQEVLSITGDRASGYGKEGFGLDPVNHIFVHCINTNSSGGWDCRAMRVTPGTGVIVAGAVKEITTISSFSAGDGFTIYDPTTNEFIAAGISSGNVNMAQIAVDPDTLACTTVYYSGKINKTNSVLDINACLDTDNNRIIVAYNENGGTDSFMAYLTLVAATSITVSGEITWDATVVYDCHIEYDPSTKQIIGLMEDTGSAAAWYLGRWTFNGTTITEVDTASDVVFSGTDNLQHPEPQIVLGRTSNDVLFFTSSVNTTDTDQVYSTFTIEGNRSNLQDFIGFAGEAGSDAETKNIVTHSGVSENQTGLTVGVKYYLNRDGSLTTTIDGEQIYAGRSLSATELLIG